MSKKMTPCERLGYKVGDEFKVVDGTGVHYAVGSFITLIHDDGSSCPRFNGVHAIFESGDSFFPLDFVEKVAKLKPAKQALADAIHQNGWRVEGGDWHKNGELPPVGEVCLYAVSDRCSAEVEITAHAKFGLCFVEIGKSGECYVSKTAELHRFIPIRTEREKAIDEMVDCLGSRWANCEEIAAHLYENGYRKEVK